MPWKNKSQWIGAIAIPGAKRQGFQKSGYQGNRVDPTWYRALYANLSLGTPKLPDGTYGPQCHAPSSWIWNTRYIASSVPHPAARNEAWSDLVASTRIAPAQLGVAFAEIGQTTGMIAERLLRCGRAYGALRRGKFRKFLRELTIGPKRKHRNKVSNAVGEASSLWLEYSFGWKPLFQDVHDGFHAIGQPLPGGKVKGKGRENVDYHYYNGGFGYEEHGIGQCFMVANVFVTNPNAYLLQQVGLANPALIAWELVPFSFVVDWVFDVGTCLGGISDFYGCTVTRSSTTYICKRFARENYILWGGVPPKYSVSGTQTCYIRKVGLDFPMPNFSLRSNIGSSLTRAANAASLLGQILTK